MTEWSVLAIPLVAGLLVLLSHAPLGAQVLRRGIVFIDLAIAQVAALGVLMAGSLSHDAEAAWWPGTLAALGGAAFVAWLSKRWPAQREALIGLVYVTAAAMTILWVSADPHGAHKLKVMLSGDVLWVTAPSLLPLAVATAAFFAITRWLGPDSLARSTVFYPCFAVLVSLSVPLLGLYLVFSTLIVPALAARSSRHPGWHAAAVGGTGYALGLAASLAADLPSGPCIVVGLLLAAGLGAALRRHRPRTRQAPPG